MQETIQKEYLIGPLRDPGRPFTIMGPLKLASQGPFEGLFWDHEGPERSPDLWYSSTLAKTELPSI